MFDLKSFVEQLNWLLDSNDRIRLDFSRNLLVDVCFLGNRVTVNPDSMSSKDDYQEIIDQLYYTYVEDK